MKDLPLSRRQLVEIAKALSRRPKILILDEATSALTAGDVERVFRVLKQLRSEGLAIVYISHRMHEVVSSLTIARFFAMVGTSRHSILGRRAMKRSWS